MEMHNTEAEQSIIGACLLDNIYIARAIELVKPSDFYKQAHQHIFQAICELNARKECSDLVTVCEELRKQKILDIIGGAPAVSALTDAMPSGANIKFYAEIVVEMKNRRLLLACAQAVANQCQDESKTVEEIAEYFDRTMVLIADRKIEGYKHVSEFMPDVIDDIQADYELKGRLKGIPTGLDELNKITSGFQKSDFVIIGARPSVGKTAIELQALIEASVRAGKRCGMFSLEMPAVKIIKRMISNLGNVSANSIRSGMLSTVNFADISNAQDQLCNAKIFINETSGMKISDIESECRRMKSKENVEIIFLDYIGLIRHPNDKMQRWQQMAEISTRMKDLCRELKIPIVCAAQLTRDDADKMPTLKSLSDSKQLEADGDVIIFLHRDGPPEVHEDKLKLIVAKQRDGATGIFDIVHKKAYGRMVDDTTDYQSGKDSKTQEGTRNESNRKSGTQDRFSDM